MVMIPKKRSSGKKSSLGSRLNTSKGLTPEQKRLNSRIGNAETRIQAAGGELPKEDNPLWMKALDVIDKPREAVSRTLLGEEDFEAFLENKLGWKDEKGKFGLHDVTSFVGDMATDPLTYLTLGAGSVAKTGLKASKEAAEAGLKKGTPEYRQYVRESTEKVRNRRGSFAGKSFGKQKDDRKKVSSGRQGSDAQNLQEKFRVAGFDRDARLGVASGLLGRQVDSFTDLDIDEFKFLNDTIDDLARREGENVVDTAKDTFNIGEDLLSEDASSQLKNLHNSLRMDDVFAKSDDFLPSQRQSKLMKRLGKTKAGEWAGKAFGGFRYVPQNQIEGALADGLDLQQGIDTVADTALRTRGRIQQEVNTIADQLNNTFNLSQEQRQALPYFIEGKFPEGFRRSDFTGNNSNNLTDNADFPAAVMYLRNQFDKIRQLEQDAGILPNTRENYVPHIFNTPEGEVFENLPRQLQNAVKNRTDTRFAKEREGADTIAEFEATNKNKDISMEKDVARLLGKRQQASITARQNKQMFEELETQNLAVRKPSNPKGFKKPEGFVEVKTVGDETFYAHPEIAKKIEQMNNLLLDKDLSDVLKPFNAAQNLWKQYVTSAIPAHHFRNFVGNVWNNTLGGVSPQSYKQSFEILQNPKKNKEIVQEAVDRGVLGQGSFAADINSTIDQAINNTLGSGSTAKRAINALPNFMRNKIGNRVEDWTRLAHFVDVYNKTGSFEEAAESTKKYLFNYFELSQSDKMIRSIVPFYTWMRNNIPLQVEQAVKQPRFAVGANRLSEESTEGEVMPEWMDNNFFGVPDNPLTGENTFYNPYLPVQDLNEIFTDPTSLGVNSISPLVKAPFEVFGANKNFFTGAPIDRYPEDGQLDIGGLANYLKGQSGILGKGIDTASGDDLINELAGLFIGEPRTVDPETELMNQQYSRDRALRDIIRKLKQQGKQVPTIRELQN